MTAMSSSAVPVVIVQALEEEREALTRQLNELGFGDGHDKGLEYDHNFADTSQVTAERGEVANLASSLQDALAEVDRALEKVELGTFGVCENCGNEIPTARLEAMPTSRLCMDCASSAR
jgi:DnaK suppressor protein